MAWTPLPKALASHLKKRYVDREMRVDPATKVETLVEENHFPAQLYRITGAGQPVTPAKLLQLALMLSRVRTRCWDRPFENTT